MNSTQENMMRKALEYLEKAEGEEESRKQFIKRHLTPSFISGFDAAWAESKAFIKDAINDGDPFLTVHIWLEQRINKSAPVDGSLPSWSWQQLVFGKLHFYRYLRKILSGECMYYKNWLSGKDWVADRGICKIACRSFGWPK